MDIDVVTLNVFSRFINWMPVCRSIRRVTLYVWFLQLKKNDISCAWCYLSIRRLTESEISNILSSTSSLYLRACVRARKLHCMYARTYIHAFILWGYLHKNPAPKNDRQKSLFLLNFLRESNLWGVSLFHVMAAWCKRYQWHLFLPNNSKTTTTLLRTGLTHKNNKNCVYIPTPVHRSFTHDDLHASLK